jgi:hypothetical protein
MDADFWRANILETVQQISDKKYQEATWLGKSEKISSPEELYCTLFDDFLFDYFLSDRDNNLSEGQLSLGAQLKDKINSFSRIDSYQNPMEILNDPQWEEIRQTAARFLLSFE